MKKARRGFTLIELMISISILSMMMVFLYQSYANLNISNMTLKREVQGINSSQKVKKVLYLDFIVSRGKITIDKKDRDEDFVTFQSSHSIYKRYNPYIAYIVKDKKLYRLESLEPIKDYELSRDGVYEVDYLGEVNSFRVYKATDKEMAYLVHIVFKHRKELLLKIKVFH